MRTKMEGEWGASYEFPLTGGELDSGFKKEMNSHLAIQILANFPVILFCGKSSQVLFFCIPYSMTTKDLRFKILDCRFKHEGESPGGFIRNRLLSLSELLIRCLGETPELTFPESFRMLLLLLFQGPHFENQVKNKQRLDSLIGC